MCGRYALTSSPAVIAERFDLAWAHGTALVLRLATKPSPEQEAEIREAERVRRPVLLIRGVPFVVDRPAIIEVSDYGNDGSPRP